MDNISHQTLVDFFTRYPFIERLIEIIIVIIAIIIINLFIKYVIYRLDKRLESDAKILGIFYRALNRPLRIITWIIGIWIILSFVNEWIGEDNNISNYTLQAIKIAIILCIAWIGLRFFKELKNHLITKHKRKDGGYNDFSIPETVNKVGQILITVITILTILSALNIPMAALLTVGGITGAALTFANQQLIANIFSGLAIFLDRPFAVGDWVYTIDGKVEGTVEKIGLRLTRIRTFDKRPIYVPNSIFNTTPMVNASRMTNRRIRQYIGVRYDDFHIVENILKEVKEMLNNNSYIDQKMTTLVNLVNGSTNMGSSTEGCYGSSSINFQIYTFTKTTNWVKFQDIQDEIMLKIGNIIEKNGAEIAFPTSTIHIPDGVNFASTASDK